MEQSPGGEELLSDDQRLRELLIRHIVAGSVLAAEIFSNDELQTISGESLQVDPAAETIEEATIVARDVEQGGGVVQAIDRVLIR